MPYVLRFQEWIIIAAIWRFDIKWKYNNGKFGVEEAPRGTSGAGGIGQFYFGVCTLMSERGTWREYDFLIEAPSGALLE
ncbi:hypothetical protein CHUAL_004447 [Chamberlinius hualienensis]